MKKKYVDLFSLGIQIYNNKMMAFSNLPEISIRKKFVGDFLKQIVTQYVIVTTQNKKIGGGVFSDTLSKKDRYNIGFCMKVAIEFCIEIGAVEYLLKSIEPLFSAKNLGNLFLEKFQPFILCDKIINFILSSDIILKLIDIYNKNGKLDILSQMLIHINIQSLDVIEIKTKLEELNLITPLIYLYMNGQEQDYFAPLEKMFDYFYSHALSSKLLLNDSEHTIDYSSALTKKIITQKDVRNCKEYNGHKILWYIRLCLTGNKFPNNSLKMEPMLYDSLVPKITYWLLNPKVLGEFLDFDPKNYFVIIKNIFTIPELRSKLVNAASNTKYAITVKTTLSSDIKCEGIETYNLIKFLVEWAKKKDKILIYYYLYDFIISICFIIPELEKDIKRDTIIFTVKYYAEMNKNLKNNEVKMLNKTLIRILEMENKFTTDDFNSMLLSFKDEYFNDIKLFLYNKVDNYKECLNLYLYKKLHFPPIPEFIFGWIFSRLTASQNQKIKYKELKENIKENSLGIAKVELNSFYELTKELFDDDYREIVSKLKKDKDIQLAYIELYIKDIIKVYENNEHNLENKPKKAEEIRNILETHISVLCDLNKYDKIIPAFKECPFYPLKECLKYCEKVKAYQPCLYIYLKEGAIDKAFKMGNSRLIETFQKLIENIKKTNNENIQSGLILLFHDILSNIKGICENNTQNTEEIWFKILEQLYKFELETKETINLYQKDEQRKKSAEELYDTIIKDIKELLEKMSSFVQIGKIIEEVSKQNKNAGFKEFRELILKILSSFRNMSNIFYSAKNLLTNLILEDENKFLILNLKGEVLDRKCSKCGKIYERSRVSNEDIYIFNCSHTYHKDCITKGKAIHQKDILCPLCTDLEYVTSEIKDPKDKSLVKNNLAVIQTKSERKKKKVKMDVSKDVEKILKNMERYDNKNLEKNKVVLNKSISILNHEYRKEFK